MSDKFVRPTNVDYSNLSEHQQQQILRAASRAKSLAMKNGDLAFFVVSFEPGEVMGECTMRYSESFQQPQVVG